MKENRQQDNDDIKTGWFFIGIMLVICAVLSPFVIMLISRTSFEVDNFGGLGSVGDFFGGSTVGLLSLASIFFIIHTIVIQREELRQTREEFSIGNETAKVQQIDNAFFNMLSLHHQIVNNIKFSKIKTEYNGREAIEKFRNDYEFQFGWNRFSENGSMKSWLENHQERNEFLVNIFEEYDTITQDELNEVYKQIYNEYSNDIGHYMRNIYRIIKFITENVAKDENEKDEIYRMTGRETIIGDRKYYFGMLRAQWSNAEYEMILVNALYHDNLKLKELILKYDVLDLKDLENYSINDSMKWLKGYRKLVVDYEQRFTNT